MVTRVVKDLVGPFSSFNHVVYMDIYFTSGPLVEELTQDKIYVAGTIKQRAVGFPEDLKSVKLCKGNYACERVYYATVFLRTTVGCVLLAMSSLMQSQVIRVQLDGTLQFQSIPPLLPAYN